MTVRWTEDFHGELDGDGVPLVHSPAGAYARMVAAGASKRIPRTSFVGRAGVYGANRVFTSVTVTHARVIISIWAPGPVRRVLGMPSAEVIDLAEVVSVTMRRLWTDVIQVGDDRALRVSPWVGRLLLAGRPDLERKDPSTP